VVPYFGFLGVFRSALSVLMPLLRFNPVEDRKDATTQVKKNEEEESSLLFLSLFCHHYLAQKRHG